MRLSKKLKRGEPRTFDTLTWEEHGALATLPDKLVSTPVLALSHYKGHLTLFTDVCDKQEGCVLMQEQLNWTKNPLSYWSRMLKRLSRNTIQHIRIAWLYFGGFCYACTWRVINSTFVLVTRRWNGSLILCTPPGKCACWRLCLFESEFDVVHIAGIKYQAADALSLLRRGVTSTN